MNHHRPILTRRALAGLAAAVVAAGLAWRLARYAMGFAFWGDEAMLGVNLLTRDAATILRPPLDYNQMAPPAFLYIQLALARLLGPSEWALRAFPLACALAAVAACGLFARRVLDRRSALAATAILACSYYAVRYGSELKPYSADLLIGIALPALAWRVHRGPDDAAAWLLLTAAGALGVWLSFPAAFVAAGAWLFLAWSVLRRPHARRPRTPALLGMAGLVQAASFAACYVLFLAPHAAASPDYADIWAGAFPPLSRPWRLPWWLIREHAGAGFAYPFGGENFGSLPTLLLMIAGAVRLYRAGRRDLLLLLVLPAGLALAASAFKAYPYGGAARTMLFLGGPVCMLAGTGLTGLIARLARPRRRRLVGAALLGLLLLAAAGGLARDVLRPYQTASSESVRSALLELRARSGRGDLWLIDHAMGPPCDSPPLLGKDNATFLFYVRTLAPCPARWGLAREGQPTSLPATRPGGGTVWLLRYAAPDLDPRYLASVQRRHDASRTRVEQWLGRVASARIARPEKPGTDGRAIVEALGFGAASVAGTMR